MAADAAIAIGLVLMVPDPCTWVLWRTEAGGHEVPVQLGPSIAEPLWYGDSFSWYVKAKFPESVVALSAARTDRLATLRPTVT
jgi:hypothetical protein